MQTLVTRLSLYRFIGPLAVRWTLGALFIWHGVAKFQAGLSMVEGMFGQWGVPAPGLAAPVVAIIEVLGGVALIIGAGTRVISLGLASLLVGAIYYAKTDLGLIPMTAPGAELDLAYLAGLVTLVVQGPGRFSVDHATGFDAEPAVRPLRSHEHGVAVR